LKFCNLPRIPTKKKKDEQYIRKKNLRRRTRMMNKIGKKKDWSNV
jgi:hypothetical protein